MNITKPTKIDVVVPAAGVGSRMGADRPKQYLKISGKTIIEHTLERVLQLPYINRVVVVIGPEDGYFSELDISRHPMITVALGGKERADSVLNGLRTATTEYVLVHDAARPCVTIWDIENLILTCTDDNGGILAAPVCDTMKRAGSNMEIEATVPRNGLYRALTPQYFKRSILIKAYEQASAQSIVLTDESSAMEAAGYRPRLVRGDVSNIKITEPQDLLLAEFYLTSQNQKHNQEI